MTSSCTSTTQLDALEAKVKAKNSSLVKRKRQVVGESLEATKQLSVVFFVFFPVCLYFRMVTTSPQQHGNKRKE